MTHPNVLCLVVALVALSACGSDCDRDDLDCDGEVELNEQQPCATCETRCTPGDREYACFADGVQLDEWRVGGYRCSSSLDEEDHAGLVIICPLGSSVPTCEREDGSSRASDLTNPQCSNVVEDVTLFTGEYRR